MATVLTARRLLTDSAVTPLTDSPTADAWTDWGEEFIAFPDPGTSVTVDAEVSGYVVRDDTAQNVAVRVAISLDGGATFTTGNEPSTSASNAAGGSPRQNVTAQHLRQGIPTGDVIVKAQSLNQTTTTGADVIAGRLVARIRAVRRRHRAPGTVLFSDDFTGSSLSSSWLAHDHAAEVNDEQMYYTPSAVAVANSLLTITAADVTGSPVGGMNYTSGLVTTAGRYSFGVGSRYEINCRLPGGGATAQGYWASSFLLGSAEPSAGAFGGLAPNPAGGTQNTGIWPTPGGSEIDVVEHAGLTLGTMDYSTNRHHNTVAGTSLAGAGVTLSDSITPSIDLTQTFNTYALVWRDDSLAFEFNGVEMNRLTAADTTLPAENERMFIIINFAIAGDDSGFEDAVNPGTTVFPATFDVDWVRVTSR